MSSSPRSAAAGTPIASSTARSPCDRPVSLDSSRPRGPRNHRTRTPSSVVRCAMSAAVRVSRYRTSSRSSSVPDLEKDTRRPAGRFAGIRPRGARPERSRRPTARRRRPTPARRARAPPERAPSPPRLPTAGGPAGRPSAPWRPSPIVRPARAAPRRARSAPSAAASQGEPGERLAPGRGATLLRRESNRSLEMLAHALAHLPAAARIIPRVDSSWRARSGVGSTAAASAARSSHCSACSTSPSSRCVSASPLAAANSSDRSPSRRACR